MDLKDKQAAGEGLDLSERRAIERYEAEFNAGATNLRWQLLDKDGKVIYGNTQEDSTKVDPDYGVDYHRGTGKTQSASAEWEYLDSDSSSSAVNAGDYDDASYHSGWRTMLPIWAEAVRAAKTEGTSAELVDVQDNPITITENQILADNDGYTKVLRVVDTDNNLYLYYPTIRACLEANQFGYVFGGPGGGGGDQRQPHFLGGQSPAGGRSVQAGRRQAGPVAGRPRGLSGWHHHAGHAGRTADGVPVLRRHKREVEGIYLNWFHRIPGDVLLTLLLLGGVGAVAAGVTVVATAYGDFPMFMQLIGVGLGVAAAAAMGLAALVTVCARAKAHPAA